MSLKKVSPQQRFIVKARRALREYEKALKELEDSIKDENVKRKNRMTLMNPKTNKRTEIKRI